MGRTQIAPGLRYINREGWGADPALPRLGGADDPRGGRRFIGLEERDRVIEHHDVIVDPDESPNVWESEAEVFAHQRTLQVARPDLGGGYMDVPYSFVEYAMADGSLVICEGRGMARSGAHTGGGFDAGGRHTDDRSRIVSWHNIDGFGIARAGNYDLAIDFDRYIEKHNWFLGWLRSAAPNLGRRRPPEAAVFGHRHFHVTACPGAVAWANRSRVRFERYEKEDELMAKALQVEGSQQVWIHSGNKMTLAGSLAALDRLREEGLVPKGPAKRISQRRLEELLQDVANMPGN